MKTLLLVSCLTFAFMVVTAAAQPVELVVGVEPSFNAKGEELVYSSTVKGQRNIYLLDETGASKRLTSSISWDGEPVFSNNDRFIIFVSDRTGNRELWRIDRFSGNLKQLTNEGGWKSNPSVSQTGVIAFISGRHPKRDVYILEGGIQRRLTHLDGEIYSPAWNPKGDKIAFVRGQDLMVINSDGSGLKVLTTGIYPKGLSWRLDRRILYLDRGIGYDLWAIDTLTLEKEKLYQGVSDSWEVNPAVSTKGDIAFSTDKDGMYKIYLFRLETTVVKIPETKQSLPLSVPDPLAVPEVFPAKSPAVNVEEGKSPVEERSTSNYQEPSMHEIELPGIYPADEEKDIVSYQTASIPSVTIERDVVIVGEDVIFWLLAALSLFVVLAERLKNEKIKPML